MCLFGVFDNKMFTKQKKVSRAFSREFGRRRFLPEALPADARGGFKRLGNWLYLPESSFLSAAASATCSHSMG
jgi:hypothetical protein